MTEHNPIVLVSNTTKRLNMVIESKFIMPLVYNVRTSKLLQKHCILTYVAGNDLPTYWTGFLFKKNSTWLPRFNWALAQTREGFANVNKKYTTPFNKNCEPEVVRGGKPFDIYSLSGAGVLLFSGIIVGLVALIVEKCLAKRLLENNFYPIVGRDYHSIRSGAAFT